ncbi:hypothetical protein M9Y10_040113, partial [Tritrichomonas musculus]
MFTIEQAGSIKKVNTIDELIIEYIKKYACQANLGSNSLNEEKIKELLKPYALTTDLFDYVKVEEINDKQDKLTFSSTKEDYETNKDSTTIVPTLSLLNELVNDKNNNIEILTYEKEYNEDAPTFLQHTDEIVTDTNVLSAKLTREFVYKYVDHVMTNLNIVKYDGEFEYDSYKSLNLTYFNETYDEKVLSMKSCISMYYDLRDKLLYDKQDKLNLISSNEKLVDIPFIYTNTNKTGTVLDHEILYIKDYNDELYTQLENKTLVVKGSYNNEDIS